MKKSLLILSVLLTLGACSTTPNNDTSGSGGSDGNGGNGINSGDPIFDESFKDSLDQIGSVAGLTQWTSITKKSQGDFKTQDVVHYFFGVDTFKDISLDCQDGKDPNNHANNIIFDNEVVRKFVRSGSLSKVSNFTIVNCNNSDITQEFATEGYTYIIILNSNVFKSWIAKSVGGSSTWNDRSSSSTIYKIAKENTDELSLINVQIEGNRYKIDVADVNEALTYVNIYKKQ
ncbi:MAG: hypothetical protein ACRCWI_03405 [Brevinema sp.]